MAFLGAMVCGHSLQVKMGIDSGLGHMAAEDSSDKLLAGIDGLYTTANSAVTYTQAMLLAKLARSKKQPAPPAVERPTYDPEYELPQSERLEAVSNELQNELAAQPGADAEPYEPDYSLTGEELAEATVRSSYMAVRPVINREPSFMEPGYESEYELTPRERHLATLRTIEPRRESPAERPAFTIKNLPADFAVTLGGQCIFMVSYVHAMSQ